MPASAYARKVSARWAPTADTFLFGTPTQHKPAARIPPPWPLLDELQRVRTHPDLYDDWYVAHVQEMRELWLTQHGLTEWDCSHCGHWNVSPDDGVMTSEDTCTKCGSWG